MVGADCASSLQKFVCTFIGVIWGVNANAQLNKLVDFCRDVRCVKIEHDGTLYNARAMTVALADCKHGTV